MSYTTDLLDQFKTKNELDSDYAAAKALGLRPNRLSNYRTGVSHADDKTAVILADALGLDRLQTIARVNMDRSRDSKERAFWRHIAAAAAVAAVAIVAFPLIASGEHHYSALLLGLAVPERFAELCIMRNEILVVGGALTALYALWRLAFARNFPTRSRGLT